MEIGIIEWFVGIKAWNSVRAVRGLYRGDGRGNDKDNGKYMWIYGLEL